MPDPTDLRLADATVLLVGTARYQRRSPLGDVPGVRDALHELRDSLRDDCGVSEVEVLLNPATGTVVLEKLHRTMTDDRPLVLYYIGHGLPGDAGLHLAVAETHPDYLVSALPYANLAAELRHRVAPTVVVLDCCYSGWAVTERAIGNAYVLASAGHNGLALAPDGRPAFTQALLAYLRDGDPEGPGELTLDHLFDHLDRTLSPEFPRPHCNQGGRVGTLVLRRNPRSAAAPGPLAPGPYPGLAAFGPGDADCYHGRGDLTVRLLARVAERCKRGGRALPVVVVGDSGSGKTSLLNAGLLPALQRGELAEHGVPGTQAWPGPIVVHPTAAPLHDLAAAVRDWLAGRAGAPAPPTAEQLRQHPARLAEVLEGAVDSDAGQRVLMVVDHFESVFTRCTDPAERAAFLDALHRAARGTADVPAAVVVIGVRSEALDDCRRHPEMSATVADAITVEALTDDELREAIAGPARRRRVPLDDALVDRIRRDLRRDRHGHDRDPGPGALALLAATLRRTWEQGGGALTDAGYEAAGRVEGVARSLAEDVWRRLEPQHPTALALLRELIGPDETGTVVRRRVHRHTLLAQLDDRPDAALVLDRMAEADARLVTKGDDTVELAHDALLHAWPVLRELAERPSAPRPTPAQRRRRRIVAASVAAVFALLAAAIVFQWQERERSSRIAAARGLLIDAEGLLSNDPVTAIRLALAADALDPGARNGLVSTVMGTRYAGALSQEPTSRSGPDKMQAVAANADGTMAATADTGYGVTLWPLPAGLGPPSPDPQPRNLPDTRSASALAFAPAGPPRLLVGDHTGPATLWDVADRQNPTLLRTLALPGSRTAMPQVAFSADGRWALAGTDDGRVLRWDLVGDGGAEVLGSGTVTGREVLALAVDPEGSLVLATEANGDGRLWDLSDPRAESRPLPASGRELTGAALVGRALPGGSRSVFAVAGGDDGTLLVWDVTGGGEPKSVALRKAHGAAVTDVAVSRPGGFYAVTTGEDRVAQVWDLRNPADPRPVGSIGGHAGRVTGVALVPLPAGAPPTADGLTTPSLLTVGEDGVALRWQLAERAHLRSATALVDSRTGWTGPINAVATTGQAPLRALTAHTGRSAYLWRVDGNRTVPRARLAHEAPVLAAALTADGRVALTGSADGSARIWDLASVDQAGDDERIAEPRARLLTRGGDADPAHDGGTNAVALAEIDGAPLAVTGGEDGVLRVWEPGGSLRRASTAGRPAVRSLAVAGDLAVSAGNDDVAYVWSLADLGAELATLVPPERPGKVRTVALSADGRLAATAGDDHRIVLWDLRDRRSPQVRAVLDGHSGVVRAAAFGPEGRSLLTAGDDRTAILWDLPANGSPVRLATLTGHGDGVLGVAFGPDGQRAVTSSGDFFSFIWDVGPALEIARRPRTVACALVGRGLTEAEWKRFVPGSSHRDPCRPEALAAEG